MMDDKTETMLESPSVEGWMEGCRLIEDRCTKYERLFDRFRRSVLSFCPQSGNRQREQGQGRGARNQKHDLCSAYHTTYYNPHPQTHDSIFTHTQTHTMYANSTFPHPQK